MKGTIGVFGLVAVALLCTPQEAVAQISYQSGQNISPAFEGWLPKVGSEHLPGFRGLAPERRRLVQFGLRLPEPELG